MGVVYKCREHGNTIRIYRRKTPPKKLEDNSMEDNKSDKIKKEHAIQLPSDDRQRAGHDCNKIKTKADYKTVMSTEELKLVKENSSASTITQLQNIFPGIDSYLKVRNRKPSTKSCLAKSRTYKKPNPLRTRERSSTDSISSLWSSLKKKSLTTKSMYQSRSKPKEAHDLEGKSDMIPAFGQVGHYNCYTEHDSDKSEGLRSRSLTYTTRKFLIQGSHNKSGTYCQQCNKSKSQMTIQMHRLASGGMVAINDQHQSICGTGLCSECSKPFPNQCKSYSFLPPDKCRSTTNYQTRCAFCKPNIDGKSQSAITIQPVISGPGRIKIPIVCAACQKKHNSQHTVCTQASGEDRDEQASAGSNSSIPKLALRSAQTLHRRTLPNYEYLAQMATDELGPVFEIPRTGKKIELRLRTVNNNNPPVHQEITIPTVGLPMCLKSEDVLSHGLESVLSVNIDRSKNAKFNTLITNMLNQNVKMEQKKIESVKQAVKESAEVEASKEEQLLNKLTNTAIQTEHTITDLVKLLEQQANQQTQECLVEPTAVKVDELKEAEKIPGSYFYWKPPKDSGPRKMELYNYADYYNLYGNKQPPRSQLAADINFQHIIAEQSGAALLESWKKINTDVSPYTGLQGNQKEPQTQFQYHASVRHHDRSQERLRDRSHGHDRMHGHDRIQGHDHIHNHDHGHCHERRHSQDRGHIQDHNHMQERSHSQDRNHSHERSHGHIHDRSHSHSRSPTPCHRHESMNRSDKNQSQHRPKHDHGGHIPETYSTRCTHDHPQSRGPSPCKVRGGTGYNDPNAILDLSRAYRHNSPQGCVGSRYTYSEYCNRHQSPERRPQGTWTSDINTSIRDHPEGKRRSRHNSPHCARRRSRSNSSNVHDNKKKSVKYEDFSCQAYDPPTTPVYDREVIPPTAFFASAPAPNYYEKPESHCMTPINNPNYQMQHYPNFERRNSVHQIPFNSQVFSARSCSPSSQQGKQMRQPCDPCMSIYTGQRSTPSPQLPPIYPDERSPGNYVSPMDGQATSIRHMVDGHLSRPSSPSNAFHNILPHHPNNNIPMQQGAQFQSPPQLCQPYPNMVAPQMQQQYMYSTPKPPMHNQQFQSMQSSPTNQMCYLAHPCESNQIKTELNLSNKDPSLCNQVTSNDPYPIKQLYACNQMKHSLDNSQNQRISNNVTLKMVNVSPGETIVESEIPSNRSSKTNIPFQNNPGLNSNLTKDGDCSSINTNMSMNHYLDHDQPQITKQWYPFNRPTTPNEKPTVNNYLNLGTQNQAKNSVCYQGTPNQPQGRSDGTINLPKQNMYYYENPHETKLNSPNQNQCSVNNTSSYVVLGPSSVMNNNPIPKFGIIPRYHEKNNRTVGGQDLFPESTSYSTNSSLLPNQIEKFIEATDINPSSSAKDVLNEPLNLRSLSPSDGSDYKQQEDAESNSRASRSNSEHNKLSRTTSSADAKRRSSPNRPSSSEPPRTSRLPPVMGKVGPIIRAILECPQSVSSRPSSAVQIVKRSGAGGRSTSSGKLKKHRPRPQTPQRTYRSTAKCAELAPVNTGYRSKKKPVKNERDRDKLSKRQGQGKSIASSEESKTFDALKASLQLTGILNHVNNSDLLGKHIKPMEPITSCSSNPSVTNVQTLGEMSNTSLTSKKKMEVCCVDCCDGPKFCVQEAPSQAVATRLENMMKTSTAFALALENLKKAASEFESINCDDTAGLLRNVSISYNKKLDQCPNNKKSESHSLVLTLSAGSCEQDLSVSSRTRGGSSLVPKNSLELPHMVQKKANNIPNENRDDPKASEQPVNQRKYSSVCCKMNPSYFVKRPSKSYMKCCNSSKCRLLFSTHYNAVKLISKTKYIPGSSCEWVNIQSCSRVPAFKVEGKGAKYELPKQNLPSPYALHSSNCHNQSTQQQSKEPMKSKGNMPKSKRLDDDNK